MKDEDLTVLSNDNDYKQLLQKGYNNLRVYNPIKKEFMETTAENYIALRSLTGDKSDNIPTLLTPKKAEKTINDPKLFEAFMAVQENNDNFQINRQLIEFRMVPEEEIMIEEGQADFDALKQAFSEMKFTSLIEDQTWNRFCSTFECLKL